MTYTFKLRGGYRFSPPSNAPVTADAFKRALERVRDPALASPGANFFRDVVSMTSDGDKRLAIRLARPAGDFLARLAMPFMLRRAAGHAGARAVHADPVGRPVLHLGLHARAHGIVLSRNPNYDGPRPPNLDQILYQLNVDQTQSLQQIEDGTADYAAGGLPTDAYAQVAQDFPTQFFVNPIAGLRYIAHQHEPPAFLDGSGAAGGQPCARPSGPDRHQRRVLGQPHRSVHPADRAGLPRREHLPAQRPVVRPTSRGRTRSSTRPGSAGRPRSSTRATDRRRSRSRQLVKDELARIGIVVDIHAFPRAEQIAREGTRGEPFDMTTEGWFNDYYDPFDTLNTFLDGTTIGPFNNNDISYFNDPIYNAQLQAAAQLTGPERYTTYGNLDVTLARDQAPLAAIGTFNNRDFFSARMGCQTFVPPYGMDLAALCIKGAHHD